MGNAKATAVLVVGGDEPGKEVVARASRYDEVFVVGSATPARTSRFFVDEERAEASARRRLARVVERLRAEGVVARGAVGDPRPAAARRDALALCPNATAVVEAA